MTEQEAQKLAEEMRQVLGCPIFVQDKLQAFGIGMAAALNFLKDKVELIKPEKKKGK